MDIQTIEKNLAKFIYELETEDRLARVGLKDAAESAKVFEKHKELFTKETLDKVQSQIKSTKKPEEKEILERIYFTLAASYIGHKFAEEEDSLKTYFSNAKVKVGNEEISYYEIAPRIAKESIYKKREMYDALAIPVVAKSNPQQEKLLNQIIDESCNLGFTNYVDYHEKAKKMDYSKFMAIVSKILKKTEKLWFGQMAEVSQEVLKHPFKKLKSVHMGYLRSLSDFDNFYPKEKVIVSFERFAKELGMGDLLKNVKIDDVNRPKKNPRAVCYWPDPPKEVHLVIKPIGGEQDFEAAFHEGGHALHGAAVSEELPYTFKVLSRSNALTEAYAFIFEDLIFEPLFLSTYLNVSAFTGQRILKQATFVNLMLLRRYLGKFEYEYVMFSENALARGPKLYTQSLDRSTGFVHRGENWLMDMDNGFYSADYLRAWIAAAQIKDYIGRKFGAKWFSDKRAGKFLRDLFEEGVKFDLEEVVSRLGYKPFDITYLVKNYEEILG